MQRIILCLYTTIAMLLALPVAAKESEGSAFRVGIWLNHALMAQGDEAIVAFLDAAQAQGINEIYPNFWFHGAVIYPGSKLVPQHPNFPGTDPLRTVINEARTRGMRVYPWAEYGYFAHFNRTDVDSEAGAILEANPDWGVLSRDGKPSVYNKGLGVAHFSLNPAKPEVRSFLTALFTEVLRLYPEVDGLHLDRIRYQSPEFSFDPYTLAAFAEATGLDIANLDEDPAVAEAFTRFRETQTTALVRDIRELMGRDFPDMELNGAVVPPYMVDEKFQRWDLWIQQGLLDTTSPMCYGSFSLVRQEIDASIERTGHPERLLVGVDVSAGEEDLLRSIQYARERGLAGVILWDDVTFLRIKPNLAKGAALDEALPSGEDSQEEQQRQRQLY